MKIASKLFIIAFAAGFLWAQKPEVYILGTGGTIAGAADTSTQASYNPSKLMIDAILKALPKDQIDQYATLKSEQVFQKASQNLTPQDWLTLGKRANEILKDPKVSGIVITHGTDTIEETAMFLQLAIKSDKPVVLVGSMRPSTALSADGPKNLFDAIVLASSPDARGKGVLLTFNGNIISASDVTKSNPVHLDTFKPVNIGYLGYLWGNKPYFLRDNKQKHTMQSVFNIAQTKSLPRVDIIYGYAGMDEKPILAAVNAGAKGIVVAGVGNGNFSDSAEKALIEASKKGVKVVRAGRIIYGPITQDGEVDDAKYGFVASWWHTPQAARIILMLGLSAGITDPLKLQNLMLEY